MRFYGDLLCDRGLFPGFLLLIKILQNVHQLRPAAAVAAVFVDTRNADSLKKQSFTVYT